MTDNFATTSTIEYGASSEPSPSFTLVAVPQPRRITITLPSLKGIGRFINRSLVLFVAFGVTCLGFAHIWNFWGSLMYRPQTLQDLLACYLGYMTVILGVVMVHGLSEV